MQLVCARVPASELSLCLVTLHQICVVVVVARQIPGDPMHEHYVPPCVAQSAAEHMGTSSPERSDCAFAIRFRLGRASCLAGALCVT
eukprot:11177862-Lingulodinium_polyedra.AAC.1